MRLISFKFTESKITYRKRLSDDDTSEGASRCATYFFPSFKWQKDMCVHNIIYISSHRFGFTQRIRRTISSQLFCFSRFVFVFSHFFSTISQHISSVWVSLRCIHDDDAHESKCGEQKRRSERVWYRSGRGWNETGEWTTACELRRLITIIIGSEHFFSFVLSSISAQTKHMRKSPPPPQQRQPYTSEYKYTVGHEKILFTRLAFQIVGLFTAATWIAAVHVYIWVGYT